MSNKTYITADKITSVRCEHDCQETVISWGRDESTATICTSDPTMVTKLKHIVERDPKNYKCFYYEHDIDKVSGYPVCLFFEIDPSLITFRTKSEDYICSSRIDRMLKQQ